MTLSNVDSPLLFPIQDGPDYETESIMAGRGIANICGVDEAGRGPLAGPVTAAAVILNINAMPEGLDDSKKLSHPRREALFAEILAKASVSCAHVSAATIDQINIREASLLAMKMAVDGLPEMAGHALIDGNALPAGLPCPATALVKGDARSLSIAAASIIAKVMRDRLMVRADKLHPGYGLAQHKGYPTKAHRDAVAQLGPSPLHRLTFAPVAAAAASATPPPKPKK
ncbi:MAG: ribonuclease HII [Rhizobiaceae bacterium]|nr:ribonuclease HII [Rhizobiaceae bacterium]